MENLMETQERLSKHFWNQATYGIRNQDGTNGLAVSRPVLPIGNGRGRRREGDWRARGKR